MVSLRDVIDYLNSIGAPPTLLLVVVALGIWWWLVGSKAWKAQVQGLEELRTEVRGFGKELRTEVGNLRDEMKSEVGKLRNEMKTEVAEVKSEVRELRTGLNGVQMDLARLEGSLNPLNHFSSTLENSALARAKSPRALTDLGKEVADEMGAVAWAESVIDELPAEDRNQEDHWLEPYAVRYATEQLSYEMRAAVNKVVFARGILGPHLIGILALVLRDRLIARKKTAEDTDSDASA